MDFGARKPGPAAAGGGGAQGDGVIKDSNTQNFGKDVVEASRTVPVIVDFWAPWCGPCKQLTPVIEKVVKAAGGKVRLVKVNIDENKALAGQLRIQSMPTVYAFRDGQPVDGFMGALPEKEIKAFVDRLIGEDTAADLTAAIEEADKLVTAGDLQSAAEIYAAVLKEDRENVAALGGLARCYLLSGDIARAEQTLALVPPAKQDAAPIASVRAAIDLKKKAGTAGDVGKLKAAVEADPKNHQARIDLAMAYAANGDKEGAVRELLESFRRDRNWNEQAARKQLVQLFDAWGPTDPQTLNGRRRLSSLMFS